MADSKLKLQIVTALDAAGITATKQQIASLEKQLGSMGQNGEKALGPLEKKLGRMPGPLGKIGDMFEGVTGAVGRFGQVATAVIGAFTSGWAVGEFIQKNIIDKIFGASDAVEELKKKNREATRQHEAMIQAQERNSALAAQRSADAIRDIDAQIKQIDKMGQVWRRAAQAKAKFYDADKDIEIQKLERERFEDVARLEDSGDYEGAQQINKVYDVLRKQLDAKKEIESFDRETLSMEKALSDEYDKQTKLGDKVFETQRRIIHLQREREKIENTARSANEYRKRMMANDRALNAAQAAYEAAAGDQDAADTQLGAMEIELLARQKNRAVLVDRQNLAVDQAAREYDRTTTSLGNPLNLNWSENFKTALAEASKESYNGLENAVMIGIKEGMYEGMKTLMEMK